MHQKERKTNDQHTHSASVKFAKGTRMGTENVDLKRELEPSPSVPMYMWTEKRRKTKRNTHATKIYICT